MFSAIILAAGESKRFGSPKQLYKINNKTLIETVIDSFTQANIDEIIIVLGANCKSIEPILPKNITIVINKNYILGQTSSIRCGVNAIKPGTQGFFICPVDTGLIKPQTIEHILKEFKQHKTKIIIPCFNGKKGHPPIYPEKITQDISLLKDDEPLYTINRRYEKDTLLVEVTDKNILKNINRPEDI